MAHKHDKKHFRDVPVQPVHYPGRGSPHIGHAFGTTKGFPQHVERAHEQVPSASERYGSEDPMEEMRGGTAPESLLYGRDEDHHHG